MGLLQTIRHAHRTARLDMVARWNPKWVQLLQQRRLTKLVRYAARRSPYFAEKYRGVNLRRPELASIPTSHKAELMEHFDQALTDPRVKKADVEEFLKHPENLGQWFRHRYALSHTSGSQGQPLLIVQDRRSLGILFSIASARSNASGRPGIREGWRRLRNPARIAIIALKRGFYPSGASFEFMQQLSGPFVQVAWFSTMQEDLIAALNDYQPNVIAAYASTLEVLALQSRRLELRSLRQLTNSSEQLTARARERILQAFPVPLYDHYGTGECLLLSEGCPTDGGAHVNADWSILEVLDENNEPVVPGEVGSKVLITNLANRIQPFIRYEIADRVVMATEPCRCGSRLPRIERIEGRAAEVFWISQNDRYRMLTGVLFHNAIDRLGEVREWQAIQRDRNDIRISLELLPQAHRNESQLRQRLFSELQELGLRDTSFLTVTVVDKLSADPSTGKFRRLISHVGPPDDLKQSFADSNAALLL